MNIMMESHRRQQCYQYQGPTFLHLHHIALLDLPCTLIFSPSFSPSFFPPTVITATPVTTTITTTSTATFYILRTESGAYFTVPECIASTAVLGPTPTPAPGSRISKTLLRAILHVQHDT